MSKRKTPEKCSLNGPRAKRQKLSNNNNDKDRTGSSRICNDNKKRILNSHCYECDNSQIPSIVSLNNHIECAKLFSKMNQRLKIYWNEDKQWYYGIIRDFESSTNESLIVYDDGESEWLNLTQSGHETVEFLCDENEIEIGSKILSGKVLETFKNGCITNININGNNLTAIAFDNDLLSIEKQTINHSNDILKLLNLCQFDTRKPIEMKQSSADLPPWTLIGDTAQKLATPESHINLIHSNKNNCTKNNKQQRKYKYNANNNNAITKKCNNKSILDLKAVYPLQKIRNQNFDKKRTVIVIGAGISGLSCARELMNYGFNVVVLEARPRAGGRILTDYSLGLDCNHGCDVGGGWIHGVDRNPLTRLVSRLKLTLHSTSGTIEMFDYCGRKVDEDLDERVEKEFNALLDTISKDKHSKEAANDISLGQRLNDYLQQKKEKSSMSVEEFNLWNWHFSNLEYSNASDLSNLSLLDWDQDDEYAFNGDHCLIQEGYSAIIHGLVEGVNIKYKQIVHTIDWNEDEIKVYANGEADDNNKNESERIYCGDAVVVTLPLGVLKNGDVAFQPSLPLWKTNAISSIGYGLLNKIFLKFDTIFWDVENDYVGYASSIHGEFYLFVNLVPVAGTPVLMSLVSGSFAAKLEEKCESEVVKYAMQILENIFCKKSKKKSKKKGIPQPIDYYITSWGKDRFSRGSYSYIAHGSSGDHYDKLSYSVGDKIYFAGEHTIRKWPASVHGAYLSGIREARKIMNNHYIHNVDKLPDRKRGKRRKIENSQLLKACLTQYPTDTIFKPIKDVTIRMSQRINNKKQRKIRQRSNQNESNQDISSMSDTSSGTEAEDIDLGKRQTLTCTLCGGMGYLSNEEKEDMDDDGKKMKKKCKSKRKKNEKLIGPFALEENNKIYIHYGCGEWSPDIHNQDNVWYNVISCIKRSKYIRCCYCSEYGATVHCHNRYCLASYHPECAHTTQYWDFNRPDEGYMFFCIKHRTDMLSLHVKQHKTKVLSSKKNLKNTLRQPRPPSIRK